MAKRRPRITDAEFEVVGGPLRAGEPHPRHKAWRFTGLHDRSGAPVFYSRRHDVRWWLWLGEMLSWGALALLIGGLIVLALAGWALQRLGLL